MFAQFSESRCGFFSKSNQIFDACRYNCPLCNKSVCDMSSVWKEIDQEIAATRMPETENRMVSQIRTTFMVTCLLLTLRVHSWFSWTIFSCRLYVTAVVMEFPRWLTSCFSLYRYGYYVTIAGLQVKCNIMLLDKSAAAAHHTIRVLQRLQPYSRLNL